MNINSSPKLYDTEATINHVKGLAFNRSSSSVTEIECVMYINNELNKDNIDCKTEYFSFIGAKRIFMRITYCYFIYLSYIISFNISYIYLLLYKVPFSKNSCLFLSRYGGIKKYYSHNQS